MEVMGFFDPKLLKTYKNPRIYLVGNDKHLEYYLGNGYDKDYHFDNMDEESS